MVFLRSNKEKKRKDLRSSSVGNGEKWREERFDTGGRG